MWQDTRYEAFFRQKKTYYGFPHSVIELSTISDSHNEFQCFKVNIKYSCSNSLNATELWWYSHSLFWLDSGNATLSWEEILKEKVWKCVSWGGKDIKQLNYSYRTDKDHSYVYFHLKYRTSIQPRKTWATEYLCHERRPRHIWDVGRKSEQCTSRSNDHCGSPDCAPGSEWTFLDELEVREGDAEDHGEEDHGPAVPRLKINNKFKSIVIWAMDWLYRLCSLLVKSKSMSPPCSCSSRSPAHGPPWGTETRWGH